MTTPRTVTIATRTEKVALTLTPNELFDLTISMADPKPYPYKAGPTIILGLEKENSDKLLAEIPAITSLLKDEGVRMIIGVPVLVNIVDSTSNCDFYNCFITLRQPSKELTLYELTSSMMSTHKL